MREADTSLDGALARLAAFHSRYGLGVVAQLVEHHNGIAQQVVTDHRRASPNALPIREDLPALSFSVPPSSPSLADAVADMLRAKEASRRRLTYVRSLRQYLSQFVRGRESTPVSAISPRDLEEWFASRHEAPSSQASNTGRLSALFSFCVRRGWIPANPCARLERISVDHAAPKILSPEEALKLMQLVAAQFPRGLAWFALGLFAGIRPEECDRLNWGAIDLAQGVVRIDAATSKVRQRRIVHLLPAAALWLEKAKAIGAELPIPNVARRRMQRGLRAPMGWEEWPHDILRHTCASYWLAAIQDAGKVAHELGNSAGILLRHYRELVTREDAAKFWAITPKQQNLP